MPPAPPEMPPAPPEMPPAPPEMPPAPADLLAPVGEEPAAEVSAADALLAPPAPMADPLLSPPAEVAVEEADIPVIDPLAPVTPVGDDFVAAGAKIRKSSDVMMFLETNSKVHFTKLKPQS